MKVRDIMTSEGLATATLDTTLAEIAQRMRDENVGAIPVVDEEDKLAGIITDRDIVIRAIAEGADPEECTAEEILTEELHTIHPEADLEDAADLMASRQIRRLPVVEDEVIVGMISLGDLAVKSEEEEAGEVLEDVSEGVRETGSRAAGRVRPGGPERPRESAGFRAGPSAGEHVAAEETEYARRGASHAGGARGRQSEPVRGREAGKSTSPRHAEESKRQQKVTPMRAESRSASRHRGKHKAS